MHFCLLSSLRYKRKQNKTIKQNKKRLLSATGAIQINTAPRVENSEYTAASDRTAVSRYSKYKNNGSTV